MLRVLGVLIVAAAVTYWNGVSAPFMFDDQNSVVNNPQIRRLWPLSEPLSPPADTPVAARPLANLSLAVDYAIHGEDVRGFRVGNLVIHVLAALMLFAVVQLTLRGLAIEPLPATPRKTKQPGQRRAAATHEASGPPPPISRSDEFRSSLAAHATAIALTIALVWMLHPLNSEVVQYISQRTESLMALCYLATLFCAIRALPPGVLRDAHKPGVLRDARPTSVGRASPREDMQARHASGALRDARPTFRWEVMAVIACAAGMACKESMITAPIMVVLYDRVFRFDSLRAAWRSRSRLYLWLAATWLVLAALIASGGRSSAGFGASAASAVTSTTPWLYLLNQAQMIARYLLLTVWPRALVLDYGLPRVLTLQDVILPGLLVVSLLAATIAAFTKWPRVAFLGAWFFITLAPSSSIIPVATEVGAERRMYLPLAALVVLAIVGVYRLAWSVAGPRRALVPLATVGAAIVVALAAGTVMRNREYASRLSIAQTIVDRWPNGRGYFLLGNELIEAGREQEAIATFRLSSNEYPPGHFALGTELAQAGNYDESMEQLRLFIALMPQSPAVVGARELLGRVLIEVGQLAAAEEQFTLILERSPANARARQMLNYVRARRGPASR